MKSHLCDRLEDYFDECLTEETCVKFEHHLEHCNVCRSELAQLGEMQEIICETWSHIRLSPDVMLRNPRPRSIDTDRFRTRERLFTWASCVGLAGAILLTFFLTHRPKPGHPGPVATQSTPIEPGPPVAFYESSGEGTLLSPVVSTADFTIVHAFPVSTSLRTEPKAIQ